MINIEHKRQVNDGINWKCGAVCLEMIYDYFQVPYDNEEIWNNIKAQRYENSVQMYSRTYKLAQDAILRGLPATIYRGRDAHILEDIDMLQTPAILSIQQVKSRESHFVVFQGIKNQNYCFCDPDTDKKTTNMKFIDVRNVWSPHREIGVTGYVFIIFDKVVDEKYKCKYCGQDIPIVHSQLLEKTEGVFCPHCDRFNY